MRWGVLCAAREGASGVVRLTVLEEDAARALEKLGGLFVPLQLLGHLRRVLEGSGRGKETEEVSVIVDGEMGDVRLVVVLRLGHEHVGFLALLPRLCILERVG